MRAPASLTFAKTPQLAGLYAANHDKRSVLSFSFCGLRYPNSTRYFALYAHPKTNDEYAIPPPPSGTLTGRQTWTRSVHIHLSRSRQTRTGRSCANKGSGGT